MRLLHAIVLGLAACHADAIAAAGADAGGDAGGGAPDARAESDPDGEADADADAGTDDDVDAGAAVITPEALLELTSPCQILAGTKPFRKTGDDPPSVDVCVLDGALFWQADMAIDCDGGTGAECLDDPWYQPETAAVDSRGNPLDASTLPYVVVPGDSNGFDYRDHSLRMGSAVVVLYDGRLAWGVLGDVGPRGNIGEASYAMAVELGIDPDPRTGGVGGGVTYIAFTGDDGVVSPIESRQEAEQVGETRALELLADNGS